MTKHQAPNNCIAPSTKQVRKTKSKIVKLYTKSGDGGESGLGDGRRLSKSDLVFEVLGGIDEANSLIGWVVVEVAYLRNSASRRLPIRPFREPVASMGDKRDVKILSRLSKVREELLRIQNTLLVVGAVVSGSDKVKLKEEEIRFLEERIDWYQRQLGEEWYKQFLLPGGTELAARLDVARTVCRRVERVLVSYKAIKLYSNKAKKQFDNRTIEQLNNVGCYLNRLSDYLFALRCYVNWISEHREHGWNPSINSGQADGITHKLDE